MKSCSFFFLLIAFANFTPSFSQDFWTPLAGPRGIHIENIIALDDGQLFVHNGTKGIQRSMDGGETWAPFNAGIPDFTAGLASNFVGNSGGRAYLIHSYQPYRCSNSDTAWVPMPMPPLVDKVRTLAADPQGRICVADLFGNIYRTENEGQSFDLVINDDAWPGSVNKLYLFGGENNFALTHDGATYRLFQFSEDGSSATLVYTPSNFLALAFHPSGKVFIVDGIDTKQSVDSGTTWQTINNFNFGNSFLTNLGISPSGSMFGSTFHAFYVSHDGGVVWTQVSPPLNDVYGFYTRMAFNQNAAFVYSMECGKRFFLRSTDDGLSWEHLEGKFTQPVVDFISTDDQGNLYAKTCSSIGLTKSADGGETWSNFLITDDQLPVQEFCKNSQGGLFASTNNFRLFRSTDGGMVWNDISPFGAAIIPNYLAVSPQDELYVFSTIQNYKSMDDGQTWENFGPDFDDPETMAFHPNGSMYVHEGQMLSRSFDGGDTWENLSGLPNIYHFHISLDGTIYFSGYDPAASEFATYLSHDELATWELTLTEAYGAITTDWEGDVFVAGFDGVYISEDQGLTWNSFADGIPAPSGVGVLHIGADRHLYCSTFNDVIYKSTEKVTYPNYVLGKVWFDENNNCQQDAGEAPLQGWFIKIESSGEQQHRVTRPDGSFHITLPPGEFQISPILPHPLWLAACNSTDTVNFSAGSDTAYVDFPIRASVICPVLNVDISTSLLRRCFSNDYTVRYCNTGSQIAEDAYVEITLDTMLIFEAATAPLLSQVGNVMKFFVGNIGVGECGNFKLTVKVSCDAALGQEHCVQINIFPDSACLVLPRTAAKDCRPNIGSYDPNDKTAMVDGRPAPELTPPGTELEFHIRYQNTGTDTAFQVVVEDHLSPLLDPLTVRPGASSHPYLFDMGDDGLLRFIFENILLPDSTVNEPASHGFVKFSVSPKTDLPLGSVIRNTAQIFFDFNDAVATNEVALTLGFPNKVSEPHQNWTVLAYPNPFRETTTLEVKGEVPSPLRFHLLDATGTLQKEDEFIGNHYELSRIGLPGGMYFFGIYQEGKWLAGGKIVVLD